MQGSLVSESLYLGADGVDIEVGVETPDLLDRGSSSTLITFDTRDS